MLRAGAKLAARLDLASFADVSSEPGKILVVDMLNVVDAELTDLAAWGKAPATATAWSATARSTSLASRAWASTLSAFASLPLWATKAGPLRSFFTSLSISILIITHCLLSPWNAGRGLLRG